MDQLYSEVLNKGWCYDKIKFSMAYNACRIIIFGLALCTFCFMNASCDNKQVKIRQENIEFDALNQKKYDPLKKTGYWAERSSAIIKYGYSLKGEKYDGVLINSLRSIADQIRSEYANSEIEVKLTHQSYFISSDKNYLFVRMPFGEYKFKKSNNWFHLVSISIVIVVDSTAEHILAIYSEGE